VHTYGYDILGRQIMDSITTLGSGVDGAVRRIETAYDTQGNAYLFTSYDTATSGGSIVNQVQREFNGLGQLITEWQAVGGAVNTSTSPKVQYAYSFTTSGSMNHSRLTSITYPNGRVLTYNYSSGLNDSLSRLSSISDSGTTLENYEYLGYGTVVKRGHPQPGVDLTYIKLSGESNADAGDQYIGLDRFGRIADNRWRTSSTELDRRQYGHDRDSNRLYFDNLVETTRDELYVYDGFNQLTSMDRGTLNSTKDGISGSSSRSQDWDYDGLGNWDSLTTDGGSAQTRGHNKQNEITSIAGASTPTYDASGNMLTDETGKQFVYDAWNRLKIVKNSGGTTLATYAYDPLGRRVRETRGSTTTDLYYSDQWQVLEERVGSDVKVSYVWSPVYVDAMIARDRDTDGNGSLDERLYVIHDVNYNIVALVDTSGAVVERFAYDAFGVFFVLTPSWGSRSSSNYAWIYLHQGGRWDADGGVYNFQRRWYSPTLGRWSSVDPFGLAANDTNLTRYVNNSPVQLQDPSGLEPARLPGWLEYAWGCTPPLAPSYFGYRFAEYCCGYWSDDDLMEKRAFTIEFFYDSQSRNIPGNPLVMSQPRIEGLFQIATGGSPGPGGSVTGGSKFRISILGLKGATEKQAGKNGRTYRVFVDFLEGTRSGQETIVGQSGTDVIAQYAGNYKIKIWKDSAITAGDVGNQYFWSDMLAHEFGLHGLGNKSKHFTDDNQDFVDTGGFERWGHGVFSQEASEKIRSALGV
jgi:RHS repeat-associated protein